MKAIRPVTDSEGDPEIYEGDLLGDDPTGFQARASIVGSEFKHQACDWLDHAGATFLRRHHMIGAYHVEGVICGTNGQQFVALAHGVLDDGKQAGLKRSDTVKKAGFDATQIRRLRRLPILLLTSHLPESTSVVSTLLADCAADIYDVFAIHGNLADFHRLRRYLHDDPFPGQLAAPWRSSPSQWVPELFDGADQPVQVQVIYGPTPDDDLDTVEEEF